MLTISSRHRKGSLKLNIYIFFTNYTDRIFKKNKAESNKRWYDKTTGTILFYTWPFHLINNDVNSCSRSKILKYYHAYVDHWNTCGVFSE